VSVVIDASGLVALVADESDGPAVAARLEAWRQTGEAIHAPELARYEIANALARYAGAGKLTINDVREAWEVLEGLSIRFHPLIDGPAAVQTALTLERRSAYDAAYLALATELDAQLWTLDGPLARNARQRGLPVRSLLDPPESR